MSFVAPAAERKAPLAAEINPFAGGEVSTDTDIPTPVVRVIASDTRADVATTSDVAIPEVDAQQPAVAGVATDDAAVTAAAAAATRDCASGRTALDPVYDVAGGIRPGMPGAARCFRVMRVGWTSNTAFELVLTADELLLLPLTSNFATAPPPNLAKAAGWKGAWQMHDDPGAAVVAATGAVSTRGGGTIVAGADKGDKDKGMCRWELSEVLSVAMSLKHEEDIVLTVGPPTTPAASSSGSGGSGGWFSTGGTVAGTKKENVTLRCRFRPQLLSAIARARDEHSNIVRCTSIASALAAPLPQSKSGIAPAPDAQEYYQQRRSRQYVAVRRRRGGLRRWKRVLVEVSPFALHQVMESSQRISCGVEAAPDATADAAGAATLLFTEEAAYPYLDMQRLGPVAAHVVNLAAAPSSPSGSRPPSPSTHTDADNALADDAQVDGVLAASGGGLIVIGHKGRLTLLDIVGSASDSNACDAADAIVEAAAASARSTASSTNVCDTHDFSSSRIRAAASALVTHEGSTRAQERAAKSRAQLLNRAREAATNLGVSASKVGAADVPPISLGSVLAHWKRYRAAVSGQPVLAAFEAFKYSTRQCSTVATHRLLIITPRFLVERSVGDVTGNDTDSIVSAARFESVYAFVRVGTAFSSACTERNDDDNEAGGFLRIEFRDGRSRHYEVLRRLDNVSEVTAPISIALPGTAAVSSSFCSRANARDALIAAAVDAATRGGSGAATCPWLAVNESPSGPGSVVRQYQFHRTATPSVVPVFTVAGAAGGHLRLAPKAALRASAEVAMAGGVSSLVFRGSTLEEQLLAAVAQAHETAMMAGVAVAMRAGRQQAEHEADIKAMAKATAAQQKHQDSTSEQSAAEQKPSRQKASNLPPKVVAAAAAAIAGFVPIAPPLLRAAAAYNANVEVCGASRSLPRATVDAALGAVLAALASLAVPALQHAHEHHIANVMHSSGSSNTPPPAAHPLAIVELLQLLFRLCGTDAGFRSCVSIDIPRPAVRAYLAPLAQRQQRAAARSWNGLEEGEEGYELADTLPPPSSTDMLDALCAGAATCATLLLAQLIAHPTEHRGVRYWSLRVVAALATHDGALPTAAPSAGGLAHAARDSTARPLARHPLLEGKPKPKPQQAAAMDGSATAAVASKKNGAVATVPHTNAAADGEHDVLEQSSFGITDRGATAEQEAVNRCELLLGSDALLPVTSASEALSAVQAKPASMPPPLALVMVALLERCENMHYEHGLQVTLVLLQTLDSLLCQRTVARPDDHQSPRAIALQAATAPLVCGVGRAYGALLSLLQSTAASPCRSIAECSARLMRAVVASARELDADRIAEPSEVQEQRSVASGAEAAMAGMLRGEEASDGNGTMSNTRRSMVGKPIKQVQTAALSSGLLLEHLGVALALDAGDSQRGPGAHQRAWATQLSRRLVATWCTNHDDAHELLARVLPPPILAYLHGLSPAVPKQTPERASVATDATMQQGSSSGLNDTSRQQLGKHKKSEGPPPPQSFASMQPQQRSQVQFDSVVARNLWRISIGGEAGAVVAATNVDEAADAVAAALSRSGEPIVADFGALFSAVERSHRSIWCHWGAETRRELREALNNESAALASARQHLGGGPVAWNHRQFRCQYPSLCAPRAFVCAGCILLRCGDKSNQEGTLLGLPAPLLKLELDALASALPAPASAPRRFLSILLDQALRSFGVALGAADDAASEWCKGREAVEHQIHSSSTMCAACLRAAAAVYRHADCASSAGALGTSMLEQLVRGLSRCHAASAGAASLMLLAVATEIDLCAVFVELVGALVLTPVEHIALAHAERILSLSADGGVGNVLDILTEFATSEMSTEPLEAGIAGAAVWRGVWARELSATRHQLQQHYGQQQQQQQPEEALRLQHQRQGQTKESDKENSQDQSVQQPNPSTVTAAAAAAAAAAAEAELELAAPLLGHGPFTVVELRQLLEQAALETGQSRAGLVALVTPACALMVRLEDGSSGSSTAEAQAVAAGGTGRWCPLAAMPALRGAAFGLKPSAAPKICTAVLERLFSCQSDACRDAKAKDRILCPPPQPLSTLSAALDIDSAAARVLPRLVRLTIVPDDDIVAGAARSLHLVATLLQPVPAPDSAQVPSAMLLHLLRCNAVPLLLLRLLDFSRASLSGHDKPQNHQALQATLVLARTLALLHTAALPAAKHVHNIATSAHAGVATTAPPLRMGARAASVRESDARANLVRATQRVASAAWAWDPIANTATASILQSMVMDNAHEAKAEAAALFAAATVGRKHGAVLSLAELVSSSSALRPLLPPPLLLLLSTAGESGSENAAAQFVRAFVADSATPALIWNGHMRDTLYRALQSHLRKCFLCVNDDGTSERADNEDKATTQASNVRAILAQAPDAPLQILTLEPLRHEELRDELWCCGLFLNCLCFGFAKTTDGSTQRFADHWGITDPLGLSAAVQGRLIVAIKSAHQDDGATWVRVALYLRTLLLLYNRSDTARVIADAAGGVVRPLGGTEAAVAAAATTTGTTGKDCTIFVGGEFAVPAVSLGTSLPSVAASGVLSAYKVLLALAFGAKALGRKEQQQASLLARKLILASISRFSCHSSAAEASSEGTAATRIIERAQLANAAALARANGTAALVVALAAAADALEAEESGACVQHIATAEAAAQIIAALGKWSGGRAAFSTEAGLPRVLARLLRWAAVCPCAGENQGTHGAADADSQLSSTDAQLAISYKMRSARLAAAVLRVAAVLAGHDRNAGRKHDAGSNDDAESHLQNAFARSALPWLGLLLCTRYRRSREHSEVEAERRALLLNAVGSTGSESAVSNFAGGPLALSFDYLHCMAFDVGSQVVGDDTAGNSSNTDTVQSEPTEVCANKLARLSARMLGRIAGLLGRDGANTMSTDIAAEESAAQFALSQRTPRFLPLVLALRSLLGGCSALVDGGLGATDVTPFLRVLSDAGAARPTAETGMGASVGTESPFLIFNASIYAKVVSFCHAEVDAIAQCSCVAEVVSAADDALHRARAVIHPSLAQELRLNGTFVRIFNAQANVAWSAWVRGRGTLDADWGGWNDELDKHGGGDFDGAACFCCALLRYLASSSLSQLRLQSTSEEADGSHRLAALSALNILVQQNTAGSTNNDDAETDESVTRLRRVQQRAVEAVLKTEVDLENGDASCRVDGIGLLLSLVGISMRNGMYRARTDVSASSVTVPRTHAAPPLEGSPELRERKATLEVLRSVAGTALLANTIASGEQTSIVESTASSEPAWPKTSQLWQSFCSAAHAMMLHSDAVCAASEAEGDATAKEGRVTATAAAASISVAALAAVCAQSGAWHTTTVEAGEVTQDGTDASETSLPPPPTHPHPVLDTLSKYRGGTFITALLAMVGAAPGCVAAAAPLRAFVDPPPSIAQGGPMNFAAGAGEAAIEQARLEAAAEETTRAAAAGQAQSADNPSTGSTMSEASQTPRLLACVLLARACAVRGTGGTASAGAMQLRALLPLTLVHAIEAAAADKSAFGDQEGGDGQHGAAWRAIEMFDAETETVRFIWNKATRVELFARLRDDLVVSARAGVAAEIAARKAECTEPEAQPAAVSAATDAGAAAAVVRRELQRPLRSRCLSAELSVQGVYIRLLVAALNRGGGGAALRGIDSSELLDSMIERFVSDANARVSGSSTHKSGMQMLIEACVGLLRARPALLHSGDAEPAVVHDEQQGPPKPSAGWRCSGALADVLTQCTRARCEGGTIAASDELSVVSDGCRQLLLALAPSPHCAEALSARGFELESLLQQADDAMTSVGVTADGMQRDEL